MYIIVMGSMTDVVDVVLCIKLLHLQFGYLQPMTIRVQSVKTNTNDHTLTILKPFTSGLTINSMDHPSLLSHYIYVVFFVLPFTDQPTCDPQLTRSTDGYYECTYS